MKRKKQILVFCSCGFGKTWFANLYPLIFNDLDNFNLTSGILIKGQKINALSILGDTIYDCINLKNFPQGLELEKLQKHFNCYYFEHSDEDFRLFAKRLAEREKTTSKRKGLISKKSEKEIYESLKKQYHAFLKLNELRGNLAKKIPYTNGEQISKFVKRLCDLLLEKKDEDPQ